MSKENTGDPALPSRDRAAHGAPTGSPPSASPAIASVPGPWVWGLMGSTEEFEETHYVRSEGRSPFLTMSEGPDVGFICGEGNARMVASTPDLLAACIEARRALFVAVSAHSTGIDFDASEHRVIKLLDAAIAKARGDRP